MKALLSLFVVLFSFSAMAVNCDIHLVKSEDKSPELTSLILDKFIEAGYVFTPVESVSDIKQQGKVAYITISSEKNSAVGAKTTIFIKDIGYDRSGLIIGSSYQNISLQKKPLIGSPEKALLKEISKSIPHCFRI